MIFDEKSMFYYEQLGFEKDKMPVNYERLKEKHYHNFYLDVYEMVLSLE